MNKYTIAIVVIALLLLGGGAYAFSNRSKGNSDLSSTSLSQNDNANESKSLKDLFAQGGAQKCTYNDKSGSSGTVYTAESKMRGDFTVTTADVSISSHMIVDGDTSYMWTDGSSQGFKTTFSSSDEYTQTETTTNETVDLNTKVDYECNSWSPDSSSFNLPDGISFTSMDSFTPPTKPDTASQCATCDSLPESAQAQCKTALGCE